MPILIVEVVQRPKPPPSSSSPPEAFARVWRPVDARPRAACPGAMIRLPFVVLRKGLPGLARSCGRRTWLGSRAHGPTAQQFRMRVFLDRGARPGPLEQRPRPAPAAEHNNGRAWPILAACLSLTRGRKSVPATTCPLNSSTVLTMNRPGFLDLAADGRLIRAEQTYVCVQRTSRRRRAHDELCKPHPLLPVLLPARLPRAPSGSADRRAAPPGGDRHRAAGAGQHATFHAVPEQLAREEPCEPQVHEPARSFSSAAHASSTEPRVTGTENASHGGRRVPSARGRETVPRMPLLPKPQIGGPSVASPRRARPKDRPGI